MPRSSCGWRACLQVGPGGAACWGRMGETLSLSSPPPCVPLRLTTLGNCRRNWASLCLNWKCLYGSPPVVVWWQWVVKEVVLQYLACVAEVPSAACLKPRLWCSPQFIWDSRGSLAAVSKSPDRPASSAGWICHYWMCISTGQILAGVPGITNSPEWLWWRKGCVEESSEQGRGVRVVASENWKWPFRLSSSSDS